MGLDSPDDVIIQHVIIFMF